MVLLNGIDTIAHTFSYNQKGHTIAVLGNGFYKIFPEENLNLYNQILKNDGLVISEYPPNEMANSNHFLERNRIVSGLSLGILVVEAAFRSGTSVTARLAQSQNRKVFTLPHEIWDSHGVGTNKLIKNGAILITSIDDILNELNLVELKKSHHNSYKPKRFAHTNNHTSIPTKNNNLQTKKPLLNNEFADIYNLINFSPISVNDLSKKSSSSINEVMYALFMLELNGYIKKVSGGYICT